MTLLCWWRSLWGTLMIARLDTVFDGHVYTEGAWRHEGDREVRTDRCDVCGHTVTAWRRWWGAS